MPRTAKGQDRRRNRLQNLRSFCLAAQFVLSLPVGWLIGRVGHGPVFAGVAALNGLGGLLTFRMTEPRSGHRPPPLVAAHDGQGGD